LLLAHDDQPPDYQFRPMRTTPRAKRVAAILLGPVAWLAAVALVAVLVKRTTAIQIGLLVTTGSLVVAVAGLGALRFARGREERSYRDRA
jgi:hypothetical protein